MKLFRTLIFIACLAIAGQAFADELHVADLVINPGESKTVAVELQNPDRAYTLLEFTLKLPEGISIVKDSKDDWAVTLNADRFDSSHTLEVGQLDNGDYKFLIYSMSNATIKGESGEILTITLTAKADAPTGNAQGLFYDQLFADANDQGTNPDDKAFNIRIGGLPGDADGSGAVTVADVTAAVSYLLGQQPEGFVFGNADIDGNGQISAEDIRAIVDIILGESSSE
ncbi:MAG: dockerin type I repeat-containing protein [Prevotella sp.]|nr:dockerin type I repeat-containing protein [Prevotella sp.]